MTDDEELERFAEAVRDAARAAEPPDAEILYGGAVRRGRRIRRNRALGTGAATVVALGAAGALAATLAMSGAGNAVSASTASAAASVSASVASAPSPCPVRTVPSMKTEQFFEDVPAGAECATTKQLMADLLGALPDSAQVLPNEWVGGPPAADLLTDRDGGVVVANSLFLLKSSGSTKESTVLFLAARSTLIDGCGQVRKVTGLSTDECTMGSYQGGRFISAEAPMVLKNGSPGVVRQVSWISREGYEVSLSILDSTQADFALTQPQMLSVLADPAWRTITGELPTSSSAAN